MAQQNQPGDLIAIPEFLEYVHAYIEYTGDNVVDFIKKFKEDFPDNGYSDKEIGDAFDVVNPKKESNPELLKNNITKKLQSYKVVISKTKIMLLVFLLGLIALCIWGAPIRIHHSSSNFYFHSKFGRQGSGAYYTIEHSNIFSTHGDLVFTRFLAYILVWGAVCWVVNKLII